MHSFMLQNIFYCLSPTVNMARAGLKHCKVALGFAVIFDMFGFTALFLGLFAPLETKGRDFGDLLVYTGAILVLISLGGWVMWYSGNIEGMPTQKNLSGIGNAVDRLARNLSRKIHTHRVHRGPWLFNGDADDSCFISTFYFLNKKRQCLIFVPDWFKYGDLKGKNSIVTISILTLHPA